MSKPMVKVGRFVHPFCDDEAKILQNPTLTIATFHGVLEEKVRSQEILSARNRRIVATPVIFYNTETKIQTETFETDSTDMTSHVLQQNQTATNEHAEVES